MTEILKFIGTKLFSGPSQKGSASAILMAVLIIIVFLFKARKGTKKPSTVEAVLMANRPSVFIKLMELICAVIAGAAILLWVFGSNSNTPPVSWQSIVVILTIAVIVSGSIFFWALRMEK